MKLDRWLSEIEQELAGVAGGVLLPEELILGDLRRKPFLCMDAQAEDRGMRVTTGAGEVVFDNTRTGRDYGKPVPAEWKSLK